MDPNGTVWALAFDEITWSRGILYLYRFDSIAVDESSDASGGQSGRLATRVLGSDAVLPLRQSADRTSAVVAQVPGGTGVVVQETTEPVQIGILRAPWCRVITADGTEGWIIGYLVDLDE